MEVLLVSVEMQAPIREVCWMLVTPVDLVSAIVGDRTRHLISVGDNPIAAYSNGEGFRVFFI